MSERAPHATKVAAVVIGRNEGARLEACLRSLVGPADPVVYVDSGSTDGSIETARRLGAEVVELDLSIPFTAARARNAGLDRLVTLRPGVEFVQFVDGDCELVAGWLDAAAEALRAEVTLAVVCGRRRERRPDSSVYNRVCDVEWDTPVGLARACGGDAMMRVAPLRAVGGYDETLIAGEEPELCLRLRRAGWRIRRIDHEMTLHDAAITRFGQWWRRAVRSGYAYAEGAWRYGREPEHYNVRPLVSILFWAAALPLIVLALFPLTHGWSLLLPLLAILPWTRMSREQRARGRSTADACAYASLILIGKFAQLQGVATFAWRKLTRSGGRLIEYKPAGSGARVVAQVASQSPRPDPAHPRALSPTILYLSGILPTLSETFVYNEVFRLRDAGRRVLTASVHPPRAALGDPRLEQLAIETHAIYERDMLREALAECLAHPLRGASTLLLALADALFGDDLPVARRPKIIWQALAGLALARHARNARVGRIHAHMAHVPTTIAMYAARQLGVPFSFTGHANDIFAQRTLLSRKLRRAAFCACISHWHREFFRAVVPLPSRRLPLIRCGVEIPAEPLEFPPPATPRIVAVGRLVEKKGFDVLIHALDRLAARGLKAECRIVGDGPLRLQLEAQALRSPAGHAVRFLGARPHDEVRRLLPDADLFVLPCRVDAEGDRDGIPVALMEAMAAGVCTVSGDLPAIRELIHDGRTGRLVAPGDPDALTGALTVLLADAALRRRLGLAGREWVREEFSAEVNTRRLLDAFDNLSAVESASVGRIS